MLTSKMAELTWEPMTPAEYARYSVSQGAGVVYSGGVYWRRVRPCFYRPLLVYRPYASSSIEAPSSTRLGGFQHAVPAGETGNSHLNLLLFENPVDYSLERLAPKRRKEVLAAEKALVVRRVLNRDHLKQEGYPVYLNFYDRTAYSYKKERRTLTGFSQWVDSVFENPKALVLGAYREGELGAVSITQWVDDVLMYSTVFSDTESLRLHVAGLMLHKVREAAVQIGGLRAIFAGLCKHGADTGVDQFYRSRGCSLVSQPARLRLNPIADLLLRLCLPQQFSKLCGKGQL